MAMSISLSNSRKSSVPIRSIRLRIQRIFIIAAQTNAFARGVRLGFEPVQQLFDVRRDAHDFASRTGRTNPLLARWS